MHTRASLALVLVACAACGRAAGDPPSRVVVPNLVGRADRDALCALQDLGLRWRFRGSRTVQSGPLRECGDSSIGSSGDDIPVTGQTPRAGARVPPGAVIVIDDFCTDLPKGQGCA